MSTVNADAIKPRDTGLDITLGATGDTTVISADSINTNTVKDSGGNTLFTSNGSGTLSSINAGLKGSFLLLNTTTASTSASVSFGSSLITSTYDVYCIKFIGVRPTDNSVKFTVNFSTDGGSNYNVTKTTTNFVAYHSISGGTDYNLAYEDSGDLASETGYQSLSWNVGNVTKENTSGDLWLFNPYSTTYVKNFYSTNNEFHASNYSQNGYVAGLLETKSVINAIDFKFETGTINTGVFKLYGLS